ncbi:antitoxin Xre/MbcA/ParS toxin-binding domain-containing protein [Shewanella atlantica]|uniref:DUF2384 domain-containing protein n=1 Tax=Shewanella atlantica TaxID=271099 RepID=A0A3S0L3F2_9GAMM|nr:antitoxin Xre/MbcA/ParS toxin-binding domain-containing protein [Shewanella atlantica]RTR26084.1 DUF2384 domain-containing protein [Shewanella atlantica]
MVDASKSHELLKQAIGTYFSKSEMKYVIPLLLNWSGNADNIMDWFENEPIPAFGKITAKSLCESGQAKQIIEYLKAIESGGFA